MRSIGALFLFFIGSLAFEGPVRASCSTRRNVVSTNGTDYYFGITSTQWFLYEMAPLSCASFGALSNGTSLPTVSFGDVDVSRLDLLQCDLSVHDTGPSFVVFARFSDKNVYLILELSVSSSGELKSVNTTTAPMEAGVGKVLVGNGAVHGTDHLFVIVNQSYMRVYSDFIKSWHGIELFSGGELVDASFVITSFGRAQNYVGMQATLFLFCSARDFATSKVTNSIFSLTLLDILGMFTTMERESFPVSFTHASDYFVQNDTAFAVWTQEPFKGTEATIIAPNSIDYFGYPVETVLSNFSVLPVSRVGNFANKNSSWYQPAFVSYSSQPQRLDVIYRGKRVTSEYNVTDVQGAVASSVESGGMCDTRVLWVERSNVRCFAQPVCGQQKENWKKNVLRETPSCLYVPCSNSCCVQDPVTFVLDCGLDCPGCASCDTVSNTCISVSC